MDETEHSSIDSIDPNAELSRLRQVLSSRERVSGLTHSFYRYPARFSPEFARAAILAFTSPGDLVVDPFAGGSTTIVEALALGRRAFGTDVNQLAVFVGRAKTTLLSKNQATKLVAWAERLDFDPRTAWHQSLPAVGDAAHHVPWPVRRTLHLLLQSALALPDLRVRRVARASVLRVGQWALDGRKHLPTRRELLRKHIAIVREMGDGAVALMRAAKAAFEMPRHHAERQRRVRLGSADALGTKVKLPTAWGTPRLVLTSPPYHGVHIVYHRWQVQGRRETAAPYWVSGCNDGRPASYYTFGNRVRDASTELRPEYFELALRSFRAVHAICDDRSVVVQLVGFSNPAAQLPLYREMMANAGFSECGPAEPLEPGGLSRAVPNRKWYLEALNRPSASGREFLLVHRKLQ